MSEPFIAEIRLFGFNFAPLDWAFCQGQIMTISQNTALFSLLGTTYGGNGTTTFGLPNLQGRVPMGQGNGSGLSPRSLGQTTGTESVTLSSTQLPGHSHTLMAQNASASTAAPGSASLAKGSKGGSRPGPLNTYVATSNATMAPEVLSTVGGGQAHENRQPYLVLNFSIALRGIFPARN